MPKKMDSLTALKLFFKKNKLGKLADLFDVLHTNSRMSVFRRLKRLHYLSSYTHSGRYYTLKDIPDFDSSGLWYFNAVGFSKFGNLKETVHHFVEQSESGSTHKALEKKLHVRVHNTLLDLVTANKISRSKVGGEYVYFSIKPSQSKKQISNRKNDSQELREAGLSDWVIIEILASIIRTIGSTGIESKNIISDLASSRNIIVTAAQVEQTLVKFDLKKTLGFL
jgi:hypothetical protein